MNHPVFTRQLRSQNIYKISDRLKTFDIEPLATRKIVIKQYECRKILKTLTSAKRQQQSILTIIQDESFVFMEMREAGTGNKPSIYTLAEKQFLEGSILKQCLGEINLASEHAYNITSFQWDGFVLEFLPFTEDWFLFIITNEMISARIKKFDDKNIHSKVKQTFQELLSRIIHQKKAYELVQIYVDELKKLFDKHPELVSNTDEEDKIINFNLIKYGKIAEVCSQQLKNKLENEKKQKSSSAMEIQK